MCDCDRPELYEAKIVKLRPRRKYKNKNRRCIECGTELLPGQQAEKVDALYDGDFQTFYTCLDCKAVIEVVRQKYPEESRCLCHGELSEFLFNEGLINDGQSECWWFCIVDGNVRLSEEYIAMSNAGISPANGSLIEREPIST